MNTELQCSCCGFLPDDEFIQLTGYKLYTCKCGQENLCDFCLRYRPYDESMGDVETINILEDEDEWVQICPACDPTCEPIKRF